MSGLYRSESDGDARIGSAAAGTSLPPSDWIWICWVNVLGSRRAGAERSSGVVEVAVRQPERAAVELGQ